MQPTPPVRRRTQARQLEQTQQPTTRRQPILQMDEPVKRKEKKQRGIVLVMLAFVLVLALVALVSPWEPLSRAHYTSATQDGSVNGLPMTGSEYHGLRISEIMSANSTAVPDDTGAYGDWVEVWNSTDRAISLRNVGLSDRGDSIRFIFPDVMLEPDGRVIVYCTDTNSSEIGKAYHAKFKLSSVGETVYLFDPSAYLLDSVKTPVLNSDESYVLLADGSYAVTEYYSPGYENTEAGFQAYLAATMVNTGELIINEVMADAKSGLSDAEGLFSDWVELYNTTDRPIDLSKYALSDKENKPLKWRFPEGAVIQPGGYYIVFCSGKDTIDRGTNIPHTNFSISAERDTVVLSDSHGRLVDRVTIDNLPEDSSYGRNENGAFVVFPLATPSLPNTQAGAAHMDYQLRMMNPTGVYITEVMLSNDSVVTAVAEHYTDWVELYNSSQNTVDLSNYGLSDNIGRARKWQFPEGTYIAPGEYKIIYCDGLGNTVVDGYLHTTFKISRLECETVCLSDPTGRVLDKLVLPEVPTNISYGRTQGRAGFFYYDLPTPAIANMGGFSGYAEKPAFTVAPGLHYSAVNVGITVPENCTVRYTLDGSEPTEYSPIYNGTPIECVYTTVVRARAFTVGDYKPSETLTGTYFINAYHSLPLVSLVVDPDDLWNPEYGMLTAGDNVDKSEGIPYKNTIYRLVKETMPDKIGHVEYYLTDGTQVIAQGAGVSLQGQYSLDMPQKTFKLRAKSLYGTKTFNAALFDDRPYTEYKGFVLRNSGNDNVWTRLVDGFQSRLLDGYGATVIHQAWNPVAVYLNGQYWGHMNMRERVDRFFVAQFEGLPLEDADKMTILEASGTSKYGSNKEYKAMLKKIKNSSPGKNQADLQYILDNVDVDNHFEYMSYMFFFGNTDPGNTRYYRLHTEGSKWKWIFYDFDYGMFNSSIDSPTSFLDPKGMGQQNIDNTIFRKLLENAEMKDKFLRKLGDVFQTFTTEYMQSVLDQCIAEIQPELQLHFSRWAEFNDKVINSESPLSPDGAYRYWEKRINRLRNTVCVWRPYRLYGYIQDGFDLTDAQMREYFGERPPKPEE